MSAFSDNPMDDDYGDGGSNPFAAPQQQGPPAAQAQQTPLGSLSGLASKVAPFFMPGVTPLMASMNAFMPDFVKNPVLMAAIMGNRPGGDDIYSGGYSPSDKYNDYYSTQEGL